MPTVTTAERLVMRLQARRDAFEHVLNSTAIEGVDRGHLETRSEELETIIGMVEEEE